MRVWLAALALMAACALPACAQAPTASAKSVAIEPTDKPEKPAIPDVVGSGDFRCLGSSTQGGAILCKAPPGLGVQLDGKTVARAGKDGLAVIGLALDQKSPARITLVPPPAANPPASPVLTRLSVVVAKRHDDISSLEMECSKIAPQTEADKQKAAESWTKKQNALRSFNEPSAPLAIAKPVQATDKQYSISSFGRTRTYIPKTKDCKSTTSVHHGTDIAVPTGTEIHAPMAGTVILADPDLFFEGGCVFLDIGRGMVSVTMHMSRIDVKPGQVVKQGELLGLSGATGRVTGPHVHWAIRYRNVFDKDRGTDLWLDPMLVLKLDAAALMRGG
jgi:murein DD-endopeptidase MepM/ murein hydrolase activator NlpD